MSALRPTLLVHFNTLFPGLRPYSNSTPTKTIYGLKRVNVGSTPGHYAKKKRKKRSVEITMHLGLDNIIKLKFTTNFDR